MSSSSRLAVLAVDSINSTCTYYNMVNKRIPITSNKRIYIISAYFFAAASDKRMRLLTSLYGTSDAHKAAMSKLKVERSRARGEPAATSTTIGHFWPSMDDET